MNRVPPCFKVLVPCWNGRGETLLNSYFLNSTKQRYRSVSIEGGSCSCPASSTRTQ